MIKEIEKIISPVYSVGGSLRDTLLGKQPNDYDFATPLSPEEIENCIRQAGKKPYLIGKRFGTIGVKIDGEMVEITTFRNESYHKNNRKPDVTFVKDITADLSRRDFTINAMGQRNGKLIDPFGGMDDLNHKIIKAVGKPTHRFKEDPLRTLRAGRFASQLGFAIDENIYKAVKQLNYQILNVSKERWMIEFDKILLCDKPSFALDFFMETRLMNFMIPELALQYNYEQNSKYHNLTLWEHTKKALDNTPKDIILRWAILLHDVGKPFVRTDKFFYEDDGTKSLLKTNYIHHETAGAELVDKIAKYLKWSNERREQVVNLVKNHLQKDSPLKQYDEMGKK